MSEIRIRKVKGDLAKTVVTIAKNQNTTISAILKPVIKKWVDEQPEILKRPIRTDLD